MIDSVLLFFLCRTIAVVVVVGLDPEDGDDLDEEEDASIDGGDDAQHLNKEYEIQISRRSVLSSLPWQPQPYIWS